MKTVRFVGYDEGVMGPALSKMGFTKTSRPGEFSVFRSHNGGEIVTLDSPGANAGYFAASAPDLTLRFSDNVDAATIAAVKEVVANYQGGRR